jgi:hypothetical protein
MEGMTFAGYNAHPQSSLFRHMYDIGSVDFVAMQWGGVTNSLLWRVPLCEIELMTWLPVFMEGIRELEVRTEYCLSGGVQASLGRCHALCHVILACLRSLNPETIVRLHATHGWPATLAALPGQ